MGVGWVVLFTFVFMGKLCMQLRVSHSVKVTGSNGIKPLNYTVALRLFRIKSW
jgi:hypothetical protein